MLAKGHGDQLQREEVLEVNVKYHSTVTQVSCAQTCTHTTGTGEGVRSLGSKDPELAWALVLHVASWRYVLSEPRFQTP